MLNFADLEPKMPAKMLSKIFAFFVDFFAFRRFKKIYSRLAFRKMRDPIHNQPEQSVAKGSAAKHEPIAPNTGITENCAPRNRQMCAVRRDRRF